MTENRRVSLIRGKTLFGATMAKLPEEYNLRKLKVLSR